MKLKNYALKDWAPLISITIEHRSSKGEQIYEEGGRGGNIPRSSFYDVTDKHFNTLLRNQGRAPQDSGNEAAEKWLPTSEPHFFPMLSNRDRESLTNISLKSLFKTR